MRIIFFLLFAANITAQTTDVTFSIDSTGEASWYFTTTNTTTLSNSDQSVQGYRSFFDNKDSALASANRVLFAIKADSGQAKQNLALADSSKIRVGRAIYQHDNSFSGPKTASRPQATTKKTPPAVETKATKPRIKREKNLKSKQ